MDAIELAIKLNDNERLMTAHRFTGVANRNRGNYVRALEFYFKTLCIVDSLQNYEIIGYSYINIGNAYIYQEKYDESLKYLLKAEEVAKKNSNERMEAYALLNTGRIKNMAGDYSQVMLYLNKVL